MADHPADHCHRRLHNPDHLRSEGACARWNATTSKLDQVTVPAWRGLKMTVGAEAADVIAVTCQVVDGAGQDVAEARSYLFELTGADLILKLAAAFTVGATTGTEVSTADQARLLVTANASGVIVLDVTDVVGASGETVRLFARQHEDQASGADPVAYGGYGGSVDFAFD